MAYLHCQIRILKPILILTANQMVTFYCEELFILYGLRFQFQLPGIGMRLEPESGSVNVNEP